MAVSIKSVELMNFRSIGEEPVVLNFNKQINVLIGANNSGKSNVISYIRIIGQRVETIKKKQGTLQSINKIIDFHRRNRNNIPTYKIVLSEESRKDFGLEEGDFHDDIYFLFQFQGNEMILIDSTIHNLDLPLLNNFSRKYFNIKFGDIPPKDDINARFQSAIAKGPLLRNIFTDFPTIHHIPHFRRLDNATIGKLAQWKQPTPERQQDKRKFKSIEKLVRELIHLPNAEIDIETEHKSINIDNDDMILPLTNYGTGVEEIIQFAVGILGLKDELICIEEPELHLHPRLQHEFIDYIIENTNNRYIFTSHSNVFVNRNDKIQLNHLWLEEGATKSQIVEGLNEKISVLNDLGSKPSDVLHANMIIWVEGPTDRLYLNKFMSIIYPELKECIDYIIMFYGSSGHLAHITVDEEIVGNDDELVNLISINNRCAVMIDSDRNKESDSISSNKLTFKNKCDDLGIVCWVTKKREIENYLPSNAISKVFSYICGSERKIEIGPYDDILEKQKEIWPECRKLYRKSNKVKYAKMIAEEIKKSDISKIDDDLIKYLSRINDVINSA